MRRFFFVALSLVCCLLFSCSTHLSECEIEPRISSPVPQICGDALSGFPDFTAQESRESWSKELFLAQNFAQELDLYRAITGYKRALFLLPASHIERKKQIEYSIILCYYLGEKYQEAIEVFEKSSLLGFSQAFSRANDLLVILYDSYRKTGNDEKAEQLLCSMETVDFGLSDRLRISDALLYGELAYLSERGIDYPPIQSTVDNYFLHAKSVKKAELLNGLLPGAGYYYVGQKQTALTSFLINSLFIAASVHFFNHGNVAAGLIIASLETGWYLGGIKGAGLAAKEFNERLYENLARETLCREKLFPILMLKKTF